MQNNVNIELNLSNRLTDFGLELLKKSDQHSRSLNTADLRTYQIGEMTLHDYFTGKSPAQSTSDQMFMTQILRFVTENQVEQEKNKLPKDATQTQLDEIERITREKVAADFKTALQTKSNKSITRYDHIIRTAIQDSILQSDANKLLTEYQNELKSDPALKFKGFVEEKIYNGVQNFEKFEQELPTIARQIKKQMFDSGQNVDNKIELANYINKDRGISLTLLHDPNRLPGKDNNIDVGIDTHGGKINMFLVTKEHDFSPVWEIEDKNLFGGADLSGMRIERSEFGTEVLKAGVKMRDCNFERVGFRLSSEAAEIEGSSMKALDIRGAKFHDTIFYCPESQFTQPILTSVPDFTFTGEKGAMVVQRSDLSLDTRAKAEKKLETALKEADAQYRADLQKLSNDLEQAGKNTQPAQGVFSRLAGQKLSNDLEQAGKNTQPAQGMFGRLAGVAGSAGNYLQQAHNAIYNTVFYQIGREPKIVDIENELQEKLNSLPQRQAVDVKKHKEDFEQMRARYVANKDQAEITFQETFRAKPVKLTSIEFDPTYLEDLENQGWTKKTHEVTKQDVLAYIEAIKTHKNKKISFFSYIQDKYNQEGAQVAYIPTLTNLDLSGMDLANADFSHAVFAKVNLSGADLRHCTLNGTFFQQTEMTEANFSESKMENAQVFGCTAKGADFSNATITGSRLVGFNLGGGNLRGAKIESTQGFAVNMSNARVAELTITNSVLHDFGMWNAKGQGVSLAGSNIKNMNCEHGELQKFSCANTNIEQLAGGHAKMRGAKLDQVNLVGAQLSSANLAEAQISQADLTLAQAKNIQCPGADIRGLNLAGANMQNANFEKCTAEKIQAENTNLTAANFSGANIKGINIADAQLPYANFSNAQVEGSESNDKTLLFKINGQGANLGDKMSQAIDEQTKQSQWLFGHSRYAPCTKKDVTGTNARLQCQRIGAAILGAAGGRVMAELIPLLVPAAGALPYQDATKKFVSTVSSFCAMKGLDWIYDHILEPDAPHYGSPIGDFLATVGAIGSSLGVTAVSNCLDQTIAATICNLGIDVLGEKSMRMGGMVKTLMDINPAQIQQSIASLPADLKNMLGNVSEKGAAQTAKSAETKDALASAATLGKNLSSAYEGVSTMLYGNKKKEFSKLNLAAELLSDLSKTVGSLKRGQPPEDIFLELQQRPLLSMSSSGSMLNALKTTGLALAGVGILAALVVIKTVSLPVTVLIGTLLVGGAVGYMQMDKINAKFSSAAEKNKPNKVKKVQKEISVSNSAADIVKEAARSDTQIKQPTITQEVVKEVQKQTQKLVSQPSVFNWITRTIKGEKGAKLSA